MGTCAIAERIVSDISGRWYAGDKKYEIQYYDPQALPLWETVIKPTPTQPKQPQKPKRGQHQNDHKRSYPYSQSP